MKSDRNSPLYFDFYRDDYNEIIVIKFIIIVQIAAIIES